MRLDRAKAPFSSNCRPISKRTSSGCEYSYHFCPLIGMWRLSSGIGSWLDEEVFAVLRARNCALCVADTDENESCELINTASWGYLRLRRRGYSGADLLHWKKRICSQAWDHAYVFFKHEDEATGPKFANEFLEFERVVRRTRRASKKG